MKLRDLIASLTPPIVLTAAKRVRFTLMRSILGRKKFVEWEYVPEGFTLARQDPDVKGWNVREVLEAQKLKWPQFLAMTEGSGPLGIAHESCNATSDDVMHHNTIMVFAYALALASRNLERISMLDWGGGIGHYYFLARALLPNVEIEYHCKDVTFLSEHGRELLPEHHFYDNDSCLDRQYDFVLASASLHYHENWSRELARLASATSGWLLVTRLPTCVRAPSYVFVQRPYSYGYNTEYVGWCINRDEFLRECANVDLTLMREFVIGEAPPIHDAPDICQYRGFLLKPTRRNGSS